jgi:hypothetical protein
MKAITADWLRSASADLETIDAIHILGISDYYQLESQLWKMPRNLRALLVNRRKKLLNC